MAAKDYFCTSTTPSTFPGSTPKHGSLDEQKGLVGENEHRRNDAGGCSCSVCLR